MEHFTAPSPSSYLFGPVQISRPKLHSIATHHSLYILFLRAELLYFLHFLKLL